MGLYDTIYHEDARICCTCGLLLRPLQTRELSNEMGVYDLVTRPTPWSTCRADWETTLHRRPGPPEPFPRALQIQGSHVISAHVDCRACQKVYEFQLEFKDGKLVEIRRAVL